MNEMITMAEIAARTLTVNVIHLLKSEIGEQGIVAALGNQVLISISKADFEQKLGNLLQKIYGAIDQHFPVRQDHLSVVIRDTDSRYENVFKIWKSV
ncbi:hypothetical protein [Mucilaginibacter inviolabilis]|uniref:hypothetical protein n=1 Tax=Mucilaginibacter inviolabilis TaxID=2714892 RepID=UPI00140AE9B5|nr:hypothetical protein [Mucilaginibacter inviolabilis]